MKSLEQDKDQELLRWLKMLFQSIALRKKWVRILKSWTTLSNNLEIQRRIHLNMQEITLPKV